MAIQHRRGEDEDFDPSKMLAGEFAVTTDDTRKVYVAFAPGDVAELAKKEDIDTELSEESENPVQNKVIAKEVSKKIDKPATAKVGQVIVVKAVDENGVPTEFEAVEMSAGSSSSSSGTSVQADWSQNDSTAADYVKNRTHNKDFGIIMAEQEITTALPESEDDLPMPMYTYTDDNVSTGDDGDQYVVTWNDVTYNCILSYENDGFIGNTMIFYNLYYQLFSDMYAQSGVTITPEQFDEIFPEFAAFKVDTGEPFMIVIYENSVMFITPETGTYTCKLEGPIFNKIDERFIPPIEALPEVTTDDNGKTLLVENGEWVAATAPTGLPEVTTDDNDKVLMVVDGVWVAGSIANGDEVSY